MTTQQRVCEEGLAMHDFTIRMLWTRLNGRQAEYDTILSCQLVWFFGQCWEAVKQESIGVPTGLLQALV